VADYYYSVVAHAVSDLLRKNDEVRHAIYEHTRTALQERLHNDPQISDAQLVNEQFALEAAISRVEDDLLLSDVRRFVGEDAPHGDPSLSVMSRAKDFVRSVGSKFKDRGRLRPRRALDYLTDFFRQKLGK
jgi:hypothetical protein